MHAVLFQTYLLAIGIEQIHVIVTHFCVFEVQINSSNKSNNRAGNTLFMIRAGLQEIIYPISTHCLAGHPLIENGTSWLDICMANIWPDVHCLQSKFRGTQREILRKRPKNNYKAWIKLSEVIFTSILGDYWEKFICSSLPARTDGRVLSQQGAPTTCKLTF